MPLFRRSYLVASVLLLLSHRSIRAASPGIQSFHLHPTSTLAYQDDSRRNKRRLPESWFHPQSNGVYATLPKHSEPVEPHRRLQVEDFHAHRHLSRYERHHRDYNDVNLEVNWDGVYREESNMTTTAERRLVETQEEYQPTPLNQGYGTHYVNLWIGQPTPQRKTVIVDTGSHYTAFPCTGCTRCGEGHHTDPYFDPSLSTTFRPLECNECIRGATCRDGKCIFSQSYTEGSSWNAYLAQDKLYCAGNDVLDAADPKNQEFAIPFMFGCQTAETGLFVTQLADGIMGMSAHESTLPKRLYDLKKIQHNMFAMCFQRQLGTSRHGVTAGVMTLGGIDEKINAGPMVYAKNMAMVGWFTVYVKNIYIQTQDSESLNGNRIIEVPMDLAAVNSGKGVIVDSGTTDTYLHKKLAKSFGTIWKQVTGKDYHHKPISLTEDQLNRLPTVLVQCAAAYMGTGASYVTTSGKSDLLVGDLDPSSPGDVLLAIPPSSYMEYSPMTKMYTSRIYFTESQGGVLGANAMLGHNVLFDWEHGRIGFARSSCEYQDDQAPAVETEQAEPSPKNCDLADATLSETCIDSLDLDQCHQNPNRILRGFETWSMVITNQGTDEGISCERAATIKAAYKGREKSKTSCDGNGLCTELRPCQLKCSDVSAAVKSKAEAKVLSGKGGCEDSWSACDASCTQTRIIPELRPDGLCHEIARATRPCHTGACARSHPCHVPYTIQAEVGFRGSGAVTWSPQSSESLVTTLVAALQTGPRVNGTTFTPGDIRIVSTAPWVPDTSKFNGKGFIVGTKAVIEIAIVNQNELSMDDPEGSSSSSFVALATGFRRREQLALCKNSELYPLAKLSIVVKGLLEGTPTLLADLDHTLGSESETLSVTIQSNVKKDDEVVPMGSFSAGFHTHRLRQYAHHRPFMAVFFFLSVSFLIFGTCLVFELVLTLFIKKTVWFCDDDKKIEDLGPVQTDASQTSSEESDDQMFEPLVSMTPDDEQSQSSVRSRGDEMLERFFNRATCTPPRKLKTEDVTIDIPSFEQSHSMDESFDRSVSRGASPRKRKTERHDVERDLEQACRKLEYGRSNTTN